MEIPTNVIELLPHGSISEIASMSGASRPTVNKVLENIGNYDGDMDIYNKVINAVETVLTSRAKALKSGHERLNKALQGCKI